MKSVFLSNFFLINIFLFSGSNHVGAQQCDSIVWLFSINEFAIDGDALLADLDAKGWNHTFFNENEVEVRISGITDCPGSFDYNTRLATRRALYLLNYFQSLSYPKLFIGSCFAIPERNCSKNNQGYHDEDRATILTVCWRPTNVQPVVNDEATVTPDNVENTVETEEVKSLDRISEMVVGQTLVLDGLNFYPGSHRTLPEAKPVLKKLVDIMNENPNLVIEIQGHVCCGKRPEEDGLDEETGETKLSWNRAKFVYEHLVKNGIAPLRISYKGYAMTKPLVTPEVTIQDQIKNRRVEVMVIAR